MNINCIFFNFTMDFDTLQLSESLSLKIDTNKLKDLLDSILHRLNSHEDDY